MAVRLDSAMLLVLALGLVCSPVAAADTAALSQRVDAHVQAATGAALGAPVADEVLLRRVWVDLTGRVPSAIEAARFLDDRGPDRHERLVEQLIQSDEFAAHWGRNLARWLTDERPIFRDNYDGRVLAKYLANAVRSARPWPDVVRALITENGTSDTSGPANLLLRFDADPIKLAGGLGKDLMGVTIQCAQCHDHPFASWRQDDFWGLAAVFARVRAMNSEQGEPLRAIAEARRGELTRPDPGASPAPANEGDQPALPEVLVKPRLPSGAPVSWNADRRRVLADWLASSDNPYVNRNLVNRVWGELFGQALVRNFDDLKKTSEARKLVDALAAEFAATGRDVKTMVQGIVLSRAYAQAANARDVRFAWSRPGVRSLSVDTLYASISRATGVEVDPPRPPEDPKGEEEEETSTVAANDLTGNSDADKNGAMMMGRPTREEDENFLRVDFPVEQLREEPRSLQRALVMMNSGYLNDAVHSGARVARAMHGPNVGAAHVDWAFLSTLTRRPTDAERQAMLGLLRDRPQDGLEDIYWVLLNSAEFQTNH